jgi:hypothetical protein
MSIPSHGLNPTCYPSHLFCLKSMIQCLRLMLAQSNATHTEACLALAPTFFSIFFCLFKSYQCLVLLRAPATATVTVTVGLIKFCFSTWEICQQEPSVRSRDRTWPYHSGRCQFVSQSLLNLFISELTCGVIWRKGRVRMLQENTGSVASCEPAQAALSQAYSSWRGYSHDIGIFISALGKNIIHRPIPTLSLSLFPTLSLKLSLSPSLPPRTVELGAWSHGALSHAASGL